MNGIASFGVMATFNTLNKALRIFEEKQQSIIKTTIQTAVAISLVEKIVYISAPTPQYRLNYCPVY